MKCVWQHLCDKCDKAGVWEKDFEALSFFIGEDVSESDVLEAFPGRIQDIGDNKIAVLKFIEFQYGSLSEECRPHRPILKLVEKHGLSERVSKGYRKGIDTLEDKIKQNKTKQNKTGQEGGESERGVPREVSEFLEAWNDLEIIKHDPTARNVELIQKALRKRKKHFSSQEILQAMKNYRRALDGTWTYRWTLWNFLSRENADVFFGSNFVPENHEERNGFKLKTKGEQRYENNRDLYRAVEAGEI